MPAPAVIPAPIAYINAAAVKGFVVECGVRETCLQEHPTLFKTGLDAMRKPFFIGRWMQPAEEAGTTHATHAIGRPSLLL